MCIGYIKMSASSELGREPARVDRVSSGRGRFVAIAMWCMRPSLTGPEKVVYFEILALREL